MAHGVIFFFQFFGGRVAVLFCEHESGHERGERHGEHDADGADERADYLGREDLLVDERLVGAAGGGAHAGRRVDIQDFMVMCPAAENFAQALDWTAEVYRAAGKLMEAAGSLAGVADEGGWWPEFASNEEAIETLVRAIARCSWLASPGPCGGPNWSALMWRTLPGRMTV